MDSMRLLEFPHSHYCEKARWALDHKAIRFTPIPLMPGIHIITLRRYVTGSSVPVLLHNERAIQGSGEIINYLDNQSSSYPLTPASEELKHECLRLEASADQQLGENIRRILYHRLLAYPDFIRYCFTHPMPGYKQWLFRFGYPFLRYKIQHTYVKSAAAVALAYKEFDLAMQTLEKQLHGRQYLVGDAFSRTDITVASMLAFIGMPPQHPFPWIDIPDTEIRNFYTRYQQHPVIIWANSMYQLHRKRST